MTLTTKITTLGLIVALAGASLAPAMANDQSDKNNMRNLALGGGAVALYGLLNHNNTATLLGAAGAALAGSQYEKDRKNQSQDNSRYYHYNRGSYNNGYNRDGYDNNGYNQSGYNRDGFNRDGFNRDGFSQDGYNRDGYNRDGRDRDGQYRDARGNTNQFRDNGNNNWNQGNRDSQYGNNQNNWNRGNSQGQYQGNGWRRDGNNQNNNR